MARTKTLNTQQRITKLKELIADGKKFKFNGGLMASYERQLKILEEEQTQHREKMKARRLMLTPTQ